LPTTLLFTTRRGRSGKKPVTRLTSSGLPVRQSVHSFAQTRNPRRCPLPGLTLTNYYYLDKIGSVSLIPPRSAASCAFRKSRNPSRCPSSSFFRTAQESAFRPLPLDGLASQPMPFSAFRAQICTNPKSASLLIPRITHTKNRYLLRIDFDSQKPASALPLCIREAHRQPPVEHRRPAPKVNRITAKPEFPEARRRSQAL
jgi:hypothetical protein